MKKHEWVNENKMLFESDHKEFNRQTNCLSSGNILANTQHGSFFRGYANCLCNGHISNPGYLQNWDLQNSLQRFPDFVKDFIRKYFKSKDSGIAHHFFYWSKNHRIDIGYIITDHNHYLIKKWYARYNGKTISALDECQKYVCD